MMKQKEIGFYECSVCHSKKKPKKTNKIIDLEYMYMCPDCHHEGSFEEFLPEDTWRFLFC
nr:hypothetical protein [Candidatus Sigynarchaeota archaeon]